MIIKGDCRDVLKALGDRTVQCVVTSPPYWGLRDYGVAGQLGLESTPEEYVANMVALFSEVKRALRDDGTCWINLGDSYRPSGNLTPHKGQRADRDQGAMGFDRSRISAPKIKPKDLVGIPWRVAFALQADGWYLRSDIIWHKPNPMPESVTDRPTKSHEYIFLLSKSERYYYDADAIKEERSTDRVGRVLGRGLQDYSIASAGPNGSPQRSQSGGYPSESRNKRTVWTIATQPYKEAHFATFPEELPKLCILAGSKPGDTVLDPFAGSGTAGRVATELGRDFLGIELNPVYCNLAEERCYVTKGML